MPTFGLGNFMYNLELKDGKANFNFYDAEDADNTAQVSVAEKDFGGFSGDSRQVAEIAYAQCSKVLNDKRDARLKKQTAEAVNQDMDEKARIREAGEDFLNNAQDVAVAPSKVEDDGTRVYNTGDGAGRDTGSSSSEDSDNSKKSK